MIDDKLRPSKPHRFSSNPQEEEFYDSIIERMKEDPLETISFIIHGAGNNGVVPKKEATEEEVHAFLATIQWLGSPIGESFLEKMGYTKSRSQPAG